MRIDQNNKTWHLFCFAQLAVLSSCLLHSTPLGFYGLKFRCGGHCGANVLQGGEQSAGHLKEALVPEGGDQAAAGRGCEGLGYLNTLTLLPEAQDHLGSRRCSSGESDSVETRG